jgi:pyrroline-5-carboxylate reductase
MGLQACEHNADAVAGAAIVVLAVKPQQMRGACADISAAMGEQPALVISIAAGIETRSLQAWLGPRVPIVRCMPNTPALVGAGITGLIALHEVPQADRQLADAILCAVGSTLWFDDERQLDAVTALSGSGPAYVFHFMEAMLAAAAQLGLTEEQARTLTLATFSGAAALAQQSSEAPAVLRQRVTSPGGTTAAALGVMAEQGVAQGIMAGIVAAHRRSQELGDLIAQPPAPPH